MVVTTPILSSLKFPHIINLIRFVRPQLPFILALSANKPQESASPLRWRELRPKLSLQDSISSSPTLTSRDTKVSTISNKLLSGMVSNFDYGPSSNATRHQRYTINNLTSSGRSTTPHDRVCCHSFALVYDKSYFLRFTMSSKEAHSSAYEVQPYGSEMYHGGMPIATNSNGQPYTEVCSKTRFCS